MDVFSIAVGAVGVGGIYFVYLVATKGLPAALAWARARWSAGKADLASLTADVAGAKASVSALEKGAVAELRAGLATARADIDALMKSAGTGGNISTGAGGNAAPAPAFLAPTQAAPNA